ncbi:hypothetical protein [Ramlibacter alkalitolerans]|uniref:DUF802 domain-containing protein n=1 Tax=Ramlibacter alkalitolerans TaxID=2039631 RepID=A0ABS1JVF0_9BURK|nr:hypothetical protein [Ramlibacter alkalitolerans]MBL0428177.1 hypothetical protein [Ramlibacter alkalitolerans]
MSKRFFAAAFGIGLAAVAWVATGFVGSSGLALAMTLVIGAVYLLGAQELRQFRAATSGLAGALATIPQPLPDLGAWLEQVPPTLRHAVRLRIEGERAGLPGPALTPYLVGLLVMLGMLGTFLGMVVTFKGAVFALEGSTDLQAIRSALAAPIKGLGLSFGTSVAGVAASAMLGLMAAIARRERLELARQLEGRIATVLQPFSLAHRRDATFQAIQQQAHALPALVDRLETMMERIEQRSRQLDEQLSARQEHFHGEVRGAYEMLADRVGTSLQASLADGARAAGDSIRPVIASTMAQLAGDAQRLHARLGEVAQGQADAQHARMDQLATAWRAEFTALREQEDARGQAAVERLGQLEAAVARHLASLGTALEAPITRLLQTASEVPQAAAGVIAQLREEVSRAADRDTASLQERTDLLERLGALLQSLQQASGEQRAAMDAMVASASSVLEQAGARWVEALQAQAGQAADTSAHLAAGAVELASVAESFAHGVQSFQAGNDKLAEALQRIEASLQRSTARSDEQLAYYVAQAREVIELSIASQQGLIENLRQLQGARKGSALALADGEPA